MQFRKILIVIASMCLISSCAATAVAEKGEVDATNAGIKFSPITHARTIELLDFIAIYPELTPETQRAFYMEVSQELLLHGNDLKLSIQQGAMLALPNSEVRDTTAAQTVLQTLLENKALNESDASLVKLLLTFTLDHNKQLSKVRDEAKKNEELKQKNKSLVQKLDDLKNIEKTMIERNTKTNTNP